MSQSKESARNLHWADIHADRIVREKGPLGSSGERAGAPGGAPAAGGTEKNHYTCASGITPSGTVHIGNFREIISVELVTRALRQKGHAVRFIYSWDDYDVFRKVPKDLPDAAAFEKYLRYPITLVPDPAGEHESFARANEAAVEALLPEVGIEPVYIYQAERYRNSHYAEGIRRALAHRDTIREILDRHRTEPLPPGWWPVTVFSTFTDKDTTTVLGWDGEYGLTYRCEETGNEETLDLRNTGAVKLLWRVDWPMRWAAEGVDFEPAGKDHHSEGGSFDTGALIARNVYGVEPPVSFQYDFISIKGRGGKLSSSAGEVVGLAEVLEVYQPEVVRYLFAGTRPNAEFSISFDLDVIKIYEDYDKAERVYFGMQQVGEKKRAKESRIYELSQVGEIPESMPVQLPFRHLCNLLLIHAGDIDRAIAAFPGTENAEAADRRRMRRRARCAWNWINTFAPEDFRFTLRTGEEEPIAVGDAERAALRAVREEVASERFAAEERALEQVLYEVAQAHGFRSKEFFALLYRVLIGKEHGPRLAGFMQTIGRERVLRILDNY
ncbi:MAG: lysine--tRNA ligase [Spirochaetaceae bacterium]